MFFINMGIPLLFIYMQNSLLLCQLAVIINPTFLFFSSCCYWCPMISARSRVSSRAKVRQIFNCQPLLIVAKNQNISGEIVARKFASPPEGELSGFVYIIDGVPHPSTLSLSSMGLGFYFFERKTKTKTTIPLYLLMFPHFKM